MQALFHALHQIHLRVLHNCKKHVSNTLCAVCQSVFLCAAHKLTAIAYQRRIKAYNEMVHLQNVVRHMDTKKIVFCQVFMYSYSNPLCRDDIVSNQLNAKHDNGTRFRQHELIIYHVQ